MKRTRKSRGANGTRDPCVTVTLDSGSHINTRGQRPEGEQREPPARWSAKFEEPIADGATVDVMAD